MELSHSIPRDFSCPSCAREFTFDVWIMVDVVERPELGFRIERGRLHHVSCPYCQTEMGIQDVPLLIYRPHSLVRMIYSKPKFATDEQSQSFFNELMSQLQAGLGESIQLEGIVATVSYEELPEFLESEPEVTRRIEEQELQSKPIEARWPFLFQTLMTLPTRRRTREYIDQHPDLLTDAALNELDRLIQGTDDSETAEMIQHYRNLLAGCRENGIEVALADATELFHEDEIFEYFDDFGPEVLSVVSGLASRGLSLQHGPNRSESAEQRAPDTEFPAPLRDKLNRAFNISQLVRWSREPAVIEATISAWQSVIKDSQIQSFPRQHAAAWDALGSACVSACRDFGQRRWANLGVEAGENASRLTVGDAGKWACCMANLGLALHAGFEAFGELADINRAAQVFGEALAVIDRTHMDWAAMKSNLAMVLIRRYEAIGELADLNEAILSTREVLEVFPRNEMSHSMLAMALSRRFEALKQKSDIDDAIKHYQQALAAINKESNDWSKAQNNLGLALTIRFEGFADASDLEQAIEAYRAAVQVTHENTPDWAIPTANLGIAAIRRFQLSGNAADLDEGIVNLKKAIASTQGKSGDWALWVTDLASAHYLKSQLGDAESLNEAIATFSLILEQLSPNEQPGIVLMVARSLGRIRFDRSEWEQSSESYRIAIEGLNALYRNQLMLAGREAWLTKAGDIYRYAAYALAKAGRTEEAIVTMEQGRGRGLRVALARDRTNLTKIRELNPALYDLYESAAARLRQLEARERSSPQKLEQEAPDQVDQDFYHQLRQARRDLETAIEKVRETPGYERFLNEPGFEDIRNAIHSTRPLIYLVPTSAGSLALLCLKDPGRESQDLTIEVVEGDLTEEELDEFILVRWSEIQDDDAAADNLESYKGQFDESLRSLGRDLIGQLAARLRQFGLKSVVLVPCGKFGLMPIHASSYEVAGETLRLLEEFDVASSPSAQALSVSLATREQRSQADPIFLGVGNPLPAVRPLNFATAEIMHLAALFKTAHPLIEESATTEAVLSKAPAAAYLHFACHGIFNADDPLDSGLELSNDEMLTLRLILSSEREAFGRAYLAVLSACETAVVEVQRTADEVISLPSGLLQMGVPGIVGCLWPVNDVSTYLLMTKFYELLLRSDEQPEPVDYGFSRVRALCRAQLWLKEVTAEELASLFEKEVNKPKTEKAMQDHLAMAAWQRFQIMKPNEQPFSHAIYWAAFTFTGS